MSGLLSWQGGGAQEVLKWPGAGQRWESAVEGLDQDRQEHSEGIHNICEISTNGTRQSCGELGKLSRTQFHLKAGKLIRRQKDTIQALRNPAQSYCEGERENRILPLETMEAL